ncbi:hypothetical protein Pyn_41263 [Prunus yedoensis var. nudiflora]|uniref:Uncharacterized protein n=1 Tax=Prunus yedoensis var. nudiflora TaxID=2094558 RepID=A0A314XRC6_PRUYE|nr:hypothetical protein Pyn_41263 [Prunus yedoensis var. nudiflora]
MEGLQEDLAEKGERERDGWLDCFFRQLDRDPVKCWNNLSEKEKWGDGQAKHEIIEFCR